MESHNMNDITAGKPEQTWWERNDDWILPLVTSGATFINPAVGAAAGAASAGYLSYENQKYNEELQEWNLQQQQLAEKRANEEYEKRLKEQNEYNEGWADRLRKEGINPFFQITKGQSGAMASSNPTAPSMSSISQALSRQPSLGELLSAQKASADIRLTNAQASQVEEQTDKAFQEGKAQFIDNCITEYMYGHAPEIEHELKEFENRYTWETVDNDDGTFDIKMIANNKPSRKEHKLDVIIYNYHDDKYGDFKILEGSLPIRRAKEELISITGGNMQMAEDMAQSLAAFYGAIMDAKSTGTKASADLVRAFAQQLEADYKYGDTFNAKWFVEKGFELADTVLSALDFVTSWKNLLKPKTTKRERHTYNHPDGTSTLETTTTQ